MTREEVIQKLQGHWICENNSVCLSFSGSDIVIDGTEVPYDVYIDIGDPLITFNPLKWDGYKLEFMPNGELHVSNFPVDGRASYMIAFAKLAI